MSATKSRAGKNEPGARLSVNEQVLKDIRTAYVGEHHDVTLISQANFMKEYLQKELASMRGGHERDQVLAEIEQLKKVMAPPERITVMLIGNHSAGKSSFVNWYVGEHIQKTSEAVETTGVTIIRRGKQKTTWKGELTFMEYPHLKDLEKIAGLKENIRCEISCSNARHFPLIDFIDTPGLTDGTLEYPFDVENVIVSLADYSHLILLFLDPHKQALCRRTMNVVRRLGEKHTEKLRFFLARADVLKTEAERGDIITQCTQELVKNLHVTHGFKLSPIYLKEFESKTSGPNRIDDLCADIEKEIESRIQDALNKWKKDCLLIKECVDRAQARNSKNIQSTISAWVWKFILALLFLALFGAGAAAGMLHVGSLDCKVVGLSTGVCDLVRKASPQVIAGSFAFFFILLLLVAFFKTRSKPTMSGAVKKRCKAIAEITASNLKVQEGSVKHFMQQSTY